MVDHYHHIHSMNIVFEGMDEEQGDCTELISCTAEALDDEMLETLLISAQQVNLEICVRHAVRRKAVGDCVALGSVNKSYCRSLKWRLHDDLQQPNGWEIQSRLAGWFPHVYVSMQKVLHAKNMYNEYHFYR